MTDVPIADLLLHCLSINASLQLPTIVTMIVFHLLVLLVGIPDAAMQAWLSFIASGIGHVLDADRKSMIGNVTVWE